MPSRWLAAGGPVDVTPADHRTHVVGRVAQCCLGVVGRRPLRSAPQRWGSPWSARCRGVNAWRLDRAIRERAERMRLELYTVNQLLAMHVRTGAGPIQAVQRRRSW
jgi:hypothetical protein